MEGFGGSRFNGVNAVMRKQRTSNSRRPRTDMSLVLESPNVSPSSSTTPSSDNTNKRSPIEDAGFVTSSQKKEFNVNSVNQRTSSLNKIEVGDASKKNRRDDKKYGNLEEFYVDVSSRDGRHGVTNHSVRSGEGYNVGQSTSGPNGSSESKLKKVKLKVGGVTRTINATPDDNGGPSAKPSYSPEVTRHRKKLILQRKAADSLVLASNTVRWVMGPTGTIITFAEDVDLSRIFGSKTTSYPPPREKCAGPSCTNAYKYRDSKLNLPLCSLQCYQAVQKRGPTVLTC